MRVDAIHHVTRPARIRDPTMRRLSSRRARKAGCGRWRLDPPAVPGDDGGNPATGVARRFPRTSVRYISPCALLSR